jgi:predicted nuclease of predicted toxin-antitoxin system
VKFLVDEALQDEVAHRLESVGHDVSHVRLRGLSGHTDDEVMGLAAEEDRVLVTTDTDFGTILALSGAAGPSVLLLRGVADNVEARVNAIIDLLPRVEQALSEGAVIVVEENRYRVRFLPIDEA